jgi:ribosome biogenesis GTPase / thiamine phosphate phosphatase
MQKKKIFEKPVVKLKGNEQEGLIVAHFGATAEVCSLSGQKYRCHLRKNSEPCITGDRVLWRKESEQTGIVVALLPRTSLLSRPETSTRNKLIAANIDAIIIVTSPPPILSLKMLDRYLVAAENLSIQPIILLNKMDLLKPNALEVLEETLALYEKIGYPVIYSTTRLPNGLDRLKTVLANKIAVLVGVSGVGKSSIISALTHQADIMIGDVSESTGLGKHTTTATRLYHLPTGGALIDSPGVREFALWHMSPDAILQGFIDFKPYVDQCKFSNCKHQSEPGCALRQALEDKKIDERRWQSYCEIISN